MLSSNKGIQWGSYGVFERLGSYGPGAGSLDQDLNLKNNNGGADRGTAVFTGSAQV